MELPVTSNCQTNSETKEQTGGIILPDFKLQGYSNQDSLVLAQKQMHRSMAQNREPRNKSTHLQSINL